MHRQKTLVCHVLPKDKQQQIIFLFKIEDCHVVNENIELLVFFNFSNKINASCYMSSETVSIVFPRNFHLLFSINLRLNSDRLLVV